MDSILTSIKKMLGISKEDTDFDTDIIIHINSAFMVLRQIGVGPEEGFSITSESETWHNYLGDSIADLGIVKTYVYLKVKSIFDPPTSSFVLESYKRMMDEFEWRLKHEVES